MTKNRHVEMTRQGSSGSQYAIADDPGMTSVQEELANVWGPELDHATFLILVVQTLRPHHASVTVGPPFAPNAETEYVRIKKDDCTWETVCICTSQVTIGDPGVNPIALTIRTTMPGP